MFDFSQPRWQADCRELNETERNNFLKALEVAFPDLRWHAESERLPSQINFDAEVVFNTIEEDIPQMISVIRRMIKELE